MHATEIALSRDSRGAPVLHDLEIAHRCCAILRLRTGAAQSQDCVNPVCNLEIGTQFRDSENAQRNPEEHIYAQTLAEIVAYTNRLAVSC